MAARSRATLSITNSAPFARKQWVTIQVPQALGHAPGYRLLAGGTLAYLGSPWGKVSQPLYVLADLSPADRDLFSADFAWKRSDLGEPDDSIKGRLPFSPWVLDDIAATVPPITVRTLDGKDHTAELVTVSARFDGPVQRFHLRGRIPGTMLVQDVRTSVFAGQEILPAVVTLKNSDPSKPEFNQPILGAWLSCGEYVHLWHGPRQGAGNPIRIGNRWHVPLLGPTTIGDGQMLPWRCSILCAPTDPAEWFKPEAQARLSNFLAELHTPLHWGRYTGWDEEILRRDPNSPLEWLAPALPPFGRVPEEPTLQAPWPPEHEAFAAYLRERGDPWDSRPWGCAKTPGQTGGQQDFGAAKGNAAWYDERLIDKLVFSADADALRPYHYAEADGSPYRKAAHSDCWMWDARPDARFSPDLLGKDRNAPRETNGWAGYDRQHWSINNLYAAAILTGDELLRSMLDEQAEVYLSSDTVPSEVGNRSTNGMDAPRAVGRTYQSMCQVYLTTGREDVSERMLKRLNECVLAQWDGGRTPTKPVRPLGVITDPRVLVVDGIPVPALFSWQEALGVMGLYALWRMTHNRAARDLCKIVATTFVENCYAQDDRGQWFVGYVRYDEGNPHPEWQKVGHPHFAVNPGFEDWCVPAVKILARLREEDGEPLGRCADILAAHAGGKPANWDQSCWRAVG